MSKFKIGDHVRVTAEGHGIEDETGVICRLKDCAGRYELMIQNRRYWFHEYELILADGERAEAEHDAVSHPSHYTSHPSGVECLTITRHMGFNAGNAMKYLWRADLKNDAIEDLKKAAFYIKDEIKKREAQ